MEVEIVVIGDGTIYQKQSRIDNRNGDIHEWLAYSLYPLQSGVFAKADAGVFWEDGQMFVGVDIKSAPVAAADEKSQPDVYVVLKIHQWEALAALIASKRRELEGRTLFGSQEEKEKPNEQTAVY